MQLNHASFVYPFYFKPTTSFWMEQLNNQIYDIDVVDFFSEKKHAI